MAIRLSKYVRQGKKTFRFLAMSGGAYDSSIAYEYGYFNGDAFRGMRFSYKKYTEFEDDPDEKDGIGATYKRIDGEWKPYDFVRDIKDEDYYSNSWGIFANGEFQPNMTWEEFFDQYESVKKV